MFRKLLLDGILVVPYYLKQMFIVGIFLVSARGTARLLLLIE